MEDDQSQVERVRGWVDEARRIVALTGAGISTESGIPDFRSPGGLWSRYDPSQLTYDRFLRGITIGRGPEELSHQRESGYDITVASEIMAILALASDLKDLHVPMGRRRMRPFLALLADLPHVVAGGVDIAHRDEHVHVLLRALALFDLPGEDGVDSVVADVNPGFAAGRRLRVGR